MATETRVLGSHQCHTVQENNLAEQRQWLQTAHKPDNRLIKFWPLIKFLTKFTLIKNSWYDRPLISTSQSDSRQWLKMRSCYLSAVASEREERKDKIYNNKYISVRVNKRIHSANLDFRVKSAVRLIVTHICSAIHAIKSLAVMKGSSSMMRWRVQ